MEEDEIMDEEVMEEEEDMEEAPEMDAQTMVMEAVEACFGPDGEAVGLEGDEAIDAVIAKLETMKTGSGDAIGGLGLDEEPMDLEEED